MGRKWGSRIAIVISVGFLLVAVANLLRDRYVSNPEPTFVRGSEPNLPEPGQVRQGVIRQGEPASPLASSGVLEPLSTDVLKKRIIETLPNAYLTLMAIIQGAALGIMTVLAQSRLVHETPLVQYATTLSQVFAIGLTIVIVTHQYLMLTSIACWVPTVFDTFIPFLLGFGEIWMALAAGRNTSWWIALSSLSLVAVFAFWYTRIRTVKGMFAAKQRIYLQHHRSITVQVFLCLIMFFTSATAAVLDSVRTCPALVNLVLVWGVIVMGLAILTQGEYDQNRVYDAYGIPRLRYRTPHDRASMTSQRRGCLGRAWPAQVVSQAVRSPTSTPRAGPRRRHG